MIDSRDPAPEREAVVTRKSEDLSRGGRCEVEDAEENADNHDAGKRDGTIDGARGGDEHLQEWVRCFQHAVVDKTCGVNAKRDEADGAHDAVCAYHGPRNNRIKGKSWQST